MDNIFNKKKVLVIGAGISGIAAVKLLSNDGADITLYESNEKADAEKINKSLDNPNNYRLCIGEAECPSEENFDLVVLSPGVPTDLAYITDMKKRGIPVIGEIELAYKHSKGQVIAITGTNGKTTTTALTGEIMKMYFNHVFVVGNIGIPFTDIVSDMTEDTVAVAEMSSFQLETIDEFRPHISAILNITPDHLNRHHTMEAYIEAKCNIFKNQNSNDYCILNYNDESLRSISNINCNIMWFSSTCKVPKGIYIDNEEFIYTDGTDRQCIMRTDELNILGRHNHENAMVGILAGILMGIPAKLIREALMNFKAVEHRIEFVKEVNGVKYYNDSKGTNPDASIKAVEAMNARTILIGGGYDKGSDYTDWIKSFNGKIKYLVLMGETAQKIEDTARELGFSDVIRVNSMQEAVEFASMTAVNGENVLLSPCCASWGMFKNYEERGDCFKQLVYKL